MSMVSLALKEVGGRLQNAAGAINSDSNMFKGSSGNALSDKAKNMGASGNAESENPDSGSKIETQSFNFKPSGGSSISGMMKNFKM